MKIKAVNIRQIQQHKFHQEALPNSHAISVSITTQEGTLGYGEAFPGHHEAEAKCLAAVKKLNQLADCIIERPFSSIKSIEQLICDELPRQIDLFAICALELALLDAWSKENEQPLYKALGGKQASRIPYMGLVPFGAHQGGARCASSSTSIFVEIGYNQIENLRNIRACKAEEPQASAVHVDVKGKWCYEDAIEQLPNLLKLGVRVIEQPFPSYLNPMMGTLKQEVDSQVMIMADESVRTLAEAKSLAKHGYCHAFKLNVSKHGGILNTLKIVRLAHKHKIKCQLDTFTGPLHSLQAANMLVSGLMKEAAEEEDQEESQPRSKIGQFLTSLLQLA